MDTLCVLGSPHLPLKAGLSSGLGGGKHLRQRDLVVIAHVSQEPGGDAEGHGGRGRKLTNT